MKHIFYPDGNAKRISWVIQTDNSQIKQMREHAEIYLDKVNTEQSKYIALHVGIFWGIGTFIIKNEDIVNIMLDSKSMYEHLKNNVQVSDPFIETRTIFIRKLIEQRKLNVKYQLIRANENYASNLL